MDLKIIKFKRIHGAYMPGNVTRRSPEEAAKLVREGVADYIETERKEIESPAVDKQIKKARVKKSV